MVKKELSLNEFVSLFRNNKGDLEGWSYEGLKALYDYFNEWEEEMGQSIEADIVAINSEWQEYKDIERYIYDYGSDVKRDNYKTDKEYKEALEEEIREKTTLIKMGEDLNEGFIINLF